MDNESALSENLRIVFLVLLIVIGAIAAFLLYQAQSIPPSVSMTAELSGSNILLFHEGGTPLTKENTKIFVDNEQVTPDQLSFHNNQAWPWSQGKTLVIKNKTNSTPEMVYVYTLKGNNELLLFKKVFPKTPEKIVIVTQVIDTSTTVPTLIPIVTFNATPNMDQSAEPIRVDFVAAPTTGNIPLSVQFIDRSKGVPTTWLWSFGDGSSSNLQNPIHLYSAPGQYDISLTVSNRFGVVSTTKRGYIHAGIMPVANFAAEPVIGEAPLIVQFTDLSTGSPVQWRWDFGDNTTSDATSPRHTYLDGGIYNVTLNVSNMFGSSDKKEIKYIKVNRSPLIDVMVQNSMYGSLLPGGYLKFRTKGGDSWIKIGGKIIEFAPNSVVQLIPIPEGIYEIWMTDKEILSFNFDSAKMYVNGTFSMEGMINSISIRDYDAIESTLTMVIPGKDLNAEVMISGRWLPFREDQSVYITNLRADTGGTMRLKRQPTVFFYKGGASGYEVRPP